MISDRHRQLLYERREQVNSLQSAINLRRWVQRISEPIEEIWSTLELLLTSTQPVPVHLIQTGSSEHIRRQAARMLGEIGSGHPEAIESLVGLIKTAQEEETCWQAALSLGKIAPDHPWGGLQKVKLIDLGIEAEDCDVALVVAITPKTTHRIGVAVQLKPVGKLDKLPGNLKISVLGQSGETRQEVTARSDAQGQGIDKSLELRFSPPSGAGFQVQVKLNDITIIEDFIT